MAKGKTRPRSKSRSKRSKKKRNGKLCGLECPFTAGYHKAQVTIMSLDGIPDAIRGRLNQALVLGYPTKHPH